jgi:hypothetical protein
LPQSSKLDGYDEFIVTILEGLYAKVSLNLLEPTFELLAESIKTVKFDSENATE